MSASDLLDDLRTRLEALRSDGLRRTLQTPAGIDFSSNDYLGLSKSAELRAQTLQDAESGVITAPASRLLGGHLEEHERLEERLAAFKGTESALLFSTGYQANLGVLTSLIGRSDRVLSDALNHASIIDALRLTGAHKVIYPHLDVAAVATQLEAPWPHGRTFLVTESYFSMDGDVAPLALLAELARTHDAGFIVDDSHGTGVFGDLRGSGLTEADGIAARCDAIVSTFGKALGGFGAFVAAPRVVTDWLVNRARSFIFTTALPPLVLRLIKAGVDLCERGADRRLALHHHAGQLRDRLRGAGLDCLDSVGPIVPVVFGNSRVAVEVSEALTARGFDVRAIRPPSVPPGTERLRISVHADHDHETVARLATTLLEIVDTVSSSTLDDGT